MSPWHAPLAMRWAAPFVIRLAQTRLAQHFRYGPLLLWAVVWAWMLAAAANVRVTIPLWKNDGIMNYWAIQYGPPSSWRHLNLGNYYARIGDLERARCFHNRCQTERRLFRSLVLAGCGGGRLGERCASHDGFPPDPGDRP